MIGLLSSIGFTTPLLLVALPMALGLLVYTYRRRGSGNRTETASLFILKKLSQSTPIRQHFSPPLRFWIELLSAILIILAAAGLFANSDQKQVAILIDNSFSMGLQLDGLGGSLFDRVKSAIKVDLDTQTSPTKYDLFVTTPELKRFSDKALSADSLMDAVDGLNPSFGKDYLTAAVSKLLQSTEYDGVWTYTDKKLVTDTSRGSTVPARIKIINVRDSVEAPLTNVAVTGITTTEGSTNKEAREIAVTLRAYGTKNVSAQLSFEAMTKEGDGEKSTLSNFATRNVSLIPGKESTFISTGLPSGWLAAHVSVSSSGDNNHLIGDDEGWFSKEIATDRVALWSNLGAHELGIDKLPFIKVDRFNPSDLNRSPPVVDPKSYRLQIFHRVAPTAPPEGSALIIFPESGAGNRWISIGNVVQSAHLTRWQDTHPINRNVNYSLLQLPVARSIEAPLWMEEILASNAGPLMLAGETEKSRIAITGFEIFPFDGTASPGMSVLTINLIKWLSEGLSMHSTYEASTVIELPEGVQSARYIQPTNKEILHPVTAAEQRTRVFFPTPGLVELISNESGNRSSIQAVNFIDASESDLTSPNEITLPDDIPEKVNTKSREELFHLLAIIGSVALLLDLLFLIIAKTRRYRYA